MCGRVGTWRRAERNMVVDTPITATTDFVAGTVGGESSLFRMF